MTNKELFYFIGKCLALDDHPDFAHEIILPDNLKSINWENFVSLCSGHLILPAIYVKFQEHEILEHLPAELNEFLKEIYDLNLERNNRIYQQLCEITQTLNEEAIYPTLLKGTAHLLDDLYSDIGERMIGDIDLMVPEKDYLKAVRILEKDGYTTSCPVPVNVENLKHYPGLSKPGAITHIEVHRTPVSEEYGAWFNPSVIEKERKEVSALPGCFVLSDKHKVIHNFIHCQLGHKGHLYGIVSYRDLYDLYLLTQRVEIEQTLGEIQRKAKAIAYFLFAGKALGLKERLHSTNNFSYWLFSKKHDLNLKSYIFYRVHRSAVYFLHRIFIGYFWQIIQCLYSKSTRKSVINRLSNLKWYKNHIKSYKVFFTEQK